MGEVCGQNTAQILALTVQTGRREREREGGGARHAGDLKHLLLVDCIAHNSPPQSIISGCGNVNLHIQDTREQQSVSNGGHSFLPPVLLSDCPDKPMGIVLGEK